MKSKLKNVLAVIVGCVVGSIANMILVTVGPYVIPPPDGVDVTNVESIKSSMHLFEFKHFIFPFLAHALGTLVGAYLAAPHRRKLQGGGSDGGWRTLPDWRHRQRLYDRGPRPVLRRGSGWRVHTDGLDRCKAEWKKLTRIHMFSWTLNRICASR